ncbi:hypothetical protein HanXRQr2_Chr03g0135411 [Helianthus annuus]|uniref:Uncharacterized protein n=1 Tax=Helianthus annuus TaxID=4232 RepID=A0A9K3JJW6_HELAN|nr:hypothetical protein HanXRQr2_Chr03g0135411 [Helianthus annuus]
MFKCVGKHFMSLLFCVLLPKCHLAEGDFADNKIRIPNLVILHGASLWLRHGCNSRFELVKGASR